MPTAKSVLTTLLLVLASGCVPAPTTKSPAAAAPAASTGTEARDALVQYSLIAALAAGDYADGFQLRKILQDGDFGIGTFDHLDGELMLLDGEMYQASADGTVRKVDLKGSTPFAAVTFFDEDGRLEGVRAASLEDLDEQLDRKLPRRNVPYAIRIDGAFSELTLRSVPRQSPPFRPLVEVARQQTTWQKQNVRGTLLGFRCPAWVGTLNVAGYHWHFLSDDHTVAGHVLACQFDNALLRYDECTSLVIRLPQSTAFDRFDKDKVKDADIEEIERQREAN